MLSRTILLHQSCLKPRINQKFIQKVLKGREETVLNFNYHPFTTSEIEQIICSRKNAELVTEEMRMKNFIILPTKYNQIGLSLKSRHLGERKQRTLRKHTVEVIRNLERCVKTHLTRR